MLTQCPVRLRVQVGPSATGQEHDRLRIGPLGIGSKQSIFAQAVEVADDHHPVRRHHRQTLAESQHGAGFRFVAVDDVQVERPQLGRQCVFDEQLLERVDQKRLFAVDEIQRSEVAVLKGYLQLLERQSPGLLSHHPVGAASVFFITSAGRSHFLKRKVEKQDSDHKTSPCQNCSVVAIRPPGGAGRADGRRAADRPAPAAVRCRAG